MVLMYEQTAWLTGEYNSERDKHIREFRKWGRWHLNQWGKVKYSMSGVGITCWPSGVKNRATPITVHQKIIQMDQQFKCQSKIIKVLEREWAKFL